MNDKSLSEKKADILAACAQASKIIESWPWWKKGLLDEAGKSTCDTPRTVIITNKDLPF